MWTALSQFEGQFLLWGQEVLRQPWLSPIVAFYTKLGDHGLIWIAVCLLMLLWPKTRRAGWAGVFALLCSLLCTNVILKHLFTRPRPWLVPLVAEGDPNSFPSGHSSAALASAAAWWHYLPRPWRTVGLACGLLMALSRLYVGVHFPTDVLCGVLVGLFCGWCGWRLEQTLSRKRESSRL